ncbi:MAG: hypothetical protein Q8R47_03495 [Nanoarchaeota archaeon]|nr:hypothetical protein [Nanoarchaeota archaeon]
MYGGTPWGYIQQKKKADELGSKQHKLEEENNRLKEIIRKLLTKEELNNSEKAYLEELKLG